MISPKEEKFMATLEQESLINETQTNVLEETDEANETPEELAVLPLRGAVVYPLTFLPLTVGQPRSIKLVDDAVLGKRVIALVAVKDEEIEDPGPEDVFTIGTMATVHRLLRTPEGSLRLLVQGMERIRIERFTQTDPYLRAQVQVVPDITEDSVEIEALMRNTVEMFRRLVALMPQLPEDLMTAALNIDDPRQLVYLVATSVRMDIEEAQEVLEIDAVKEKLGKLLGILTREVEVLELGKKIQNEAQSEMGKMQREYFLHEQMKAIKKELGEEDEIAIETKELEEQIEQSGMPEEAEKEARRELKRLEKMPPAAAEYSLIKTYLDWLVSLPWQVSTEDKLDITRARRVLDEDHYDLDKIKERILEYLAVRKLKLERAEEELAEEQQESEEGEETAEEDEEKYEDLIRKRREGAILCFIGPPGTGKTSLGRSVARAMGRKFVRMSLGGLRDEAEIRGHRRTYIGSMPGRIIQAIKRAGSNNPIFMLDEVDKVGQDWRGDPSSALLEVLDPEQNSDFRDHYLDVPFDLSKVMFIATGNTMGPIPQPLLDRMEVLTLDGYTEGEKVKIAQQYLVPRQIDENGLRPEEIEFEDGALRIIIREYTREAGLRNLEREIGSVCRKIATKIAEGTMENMPEVITDEKARELLGKQKYFPEVSERTEIPGVATGLAVTAHGGDILFIEATKMLGKKGLTLTGQLGEVMKESAQAALSYVRSKSSDLGIEEDFFEKNDVHLHIPAGAIPKDGPSAGVAIATALVSLLTDSPIDSDVGMTGEITLRGKVLPVGGIKQKVLAARRAGLDRVILPERNEKDLEDVPEEIRNEMNFIFADRVEEVFSGAFTRNPITTQLTSETSGQKQG